MKRFFTRAAAFLLSAALLAGTAAADGGTVYSRSLAVSDLTYTNTIRYGSAGRLETYALETTPGGNVRPIVMACDTIYGGMTLPTMVSYAEKQGYNVVGAINADYYYGNSIPIGVVIEDGIYKSSPEWNNAAAFLPDGSAFISDSPTITVTLENRGGAPLTPGEDGSVPASNAGKSVTLTHYNKTRADGGGLYLLNEYFSSVSTRTSSPGWMVRLQAEEGEMTVDGRMTFTVTELIEGSAAQPIGKGNFILTADDSSNLHAEFEKFAVATGWNSPSAAPIPALRRRNGPRAQATFCWKTARPPIPIAGPSPPREKRPAPRWVSVLTAASCFWRLTGGRAAIPWVLRSRSLPSC